MSIIPHVCAAHVNSLASHALHHPSSVPLMSCLLLPMQFLVATETFGMGVNMPARSVVFNGFSKPDGGDSELLSVFLHGMSLAFHHYCRLIFTLLVLFS